jgi:hypothetical protein
MDKTAQTAKDRATFQALRHRNFQLFFLPAYLVQQ